MNEVKVYFCNIIKQISLYYLGSVIIKSYMSLTQRQANNNEQFGNSPKVRKQKVKIKRSPKLIMPLIRKNPNFVEKYIKQFDEKMKQSHSSPQTLKSRIQNSYKQSSLTSRQLSPMGTMITKPPTNDKDTKSCIKYQTIEGQQSEEKIELLNKLQMDYVRLKQGSRLNRKFPALRSHNSSTNDPLAFISSEEVEKEIKKPAKSHSGQRYFADLQLMKQGRDHFLRSLENSGKAGESGWGGGSYEAEVAARKQDYVRHKIMQDRSLKKQKMMTGRTMNFNVYYQMLALSPRERNRLRGASKFETAYGV